MQGKFRKPSPNVYEHPDGFSVEDLDMTHLRYREGHRQLTIRCEPKRGPTLLVAYVEEAERWDPPHADAPLTPEDRSRIGARLRAAFASEDADVDVA